MNNEDTLEYYAARIAELQGELAEKRQEMKEYMKELRRMYSALKTKVKKYEKIILKLDEVKDKRHILYTSAMVQLALNKYRNIEVRIARGIEQKKFFVQRCRELPLHRPQREEFLEERVRRILLHYQDFKFRILEAENDLRIANKHLNRADEYFAFLRKLRK